MNGLRNRGRASRGGLSDPDFAWSDFFLLDYDRVIVRPVVCECRINADTPLIPVIQPLLAIAGIDPFGRVAQKEVFAHLQPRTLQHRKDDLFSSAGVGGGLQNHERAGPQVSRQLLGRLQDVT